MPDSSLLDGRADLFALGVILYELLSGRHPFGPLSLKLSPQELHLLLLQQERSGPQPLRSVNPRVERSLARVVERCLAYNPNDRPQSAEELAALLRKGLSPLRRTLRWLRQHPRTVVPMAVFVLATSVVGDYLWSSREPYGVRELNQGLHAYRHGQYSEAVQHFNQALEADPNSAAILFVRGRTYQQLGHADKRNFRLAWDDFRQADELAPDGRTRACMGYCLNHMGQPREAVLFYNQAVDAGFRTAEVFNNLGYTYLDLRRMDDAQRSLELALQLDPDLRAAHHNRALLRFRQALRLLQQGSLQAGGQERARQEARRYLAEGIKDIRRAIELGPVTAGVYLDAARLCEVAARHDPLWAEPALDYVRLAVREGYDPGQLKTDLFLSVLKERREFTTLAEKPASSPLAQPTPLLLDPIQTNID